MRQRRLVDVDGEKVSPVNQDEMEQVSDTTNSNGSGNAAEINLGTLRKDVDIHYEISGAADVQVEVSKDGSSWRPFHTESLASAGNDVLQFDTAYKHIRAYATANTTRVEVVSRGG